MFIFFCLFLTNIFVSESLNIATKIPEHVENILKSNITDLRRLINGTRRIINGDDVRNNRPYMVYLRLPQNNPRYKDYRRWLCGGVIIHEEYILTSAACIEDAKHFYIVSGTYRYSEEDDRQSNPCIKNGAKKAIWKCVPRNYVFDGHENDNIRWMNNDIAIVKVEDDFDFNRRIRGCDFVPKPICYNNITSRLEEPGTIGSIAGWGSTAKYNDWVNKRSGFTQDLLETNVIVVPKSRCKHRWGARYHNIIDNYMICTKDTIPELSEACQEKYTECTDIMYSGEFDSEDARRANPNETFVHNAIHESGRRQKAGSGGFCENDHGGPLVHGTGPNAVVIGVISACLVKERTNRCHGPFLYTSVFKNRILINCAIYKDVKGDCSKLFRASETHIEEDISWVDHPDGPAKNEISKMRRNKDQVNSTEKSIPTPFDKIIQHGGVILRTSDSKENAIDVATHLPPEVNKLLNLSETRRIINGEEVTDGRPYMVYLKLPRSNQKKPNYRTWLCGGVIVHEEYIITSAACIEDAEHFYVVSGTYKYSDEDDRYNNPCIKNGAKKAIWKCVPKNYIFDGHENDNIRWMNNDIAVVKIEDGFDFNRRIRGCDFVPKPICYNNQSQTLENPGTVVTIAGWGTTSRYNEWVSRRKENQQNLLEAHVEVIPKNRCKRRWGARYHNIIDNYMICTKDIGQTMSEICNEKYVDCQDIHYSDEEDMRREIKVMKSEKVPTNLVMHSAYHNDTNGTRRYVSQADGGFCENDHGGPLVYGEGVNSVVIGVISACLVKERTNKCYGPFLYTSVFKNRQFISCAIYKDVEPKCRRQFRSGVTHVEKTLSWKNHPDGPAKNELPPSTPGKSLDAADDKVFAGSGFIMRADDLRQANKTLS